MSVVASFLHKCNNTGSTEVQDLSYMSFSLIAWNEQISSLKYAKLVKNFTMLSHTLSFLFNIIWKVFQAKNVSLSSCVIIALTYIHISWWARVLLSVALLQSEAIIKREESCTRISLYIGDAAENILILTAYEDF